VIVTCGLLQAAAESHNRRGSDAGPFDGLAHLIALVARQSSRVRQIMSGIEAAISMG
jgi:hypothetical protein